VETYDEDPIGWVSAADLHCETNPLTVKGCETKALVGAHGDTRVEVCAIGAERKGLIRTQPVTAYPSSTAQDCGGSSDCQALGGFDIVFVHGERNGRVFVASDSHLISGIRVQGWVDTDKIIPWNNQLGIRPAENLTFSGNGDVAGGEGSVCAYASVTDALEDKDCRPILGGKRWYQSPLRMPVLARYNVTETKGGQPRQFIEVAVPNAGSDLNRLIVEDTDDIETDVWILDKYLSDWQRILRPFIAPLPAERAKETLLRLLTESLSTTLGTAIPVGGDSFEDIVRRTQKLPVRFQSPLMGYTGDELFIPDAIKRCEVRALGRWAAASLRFLTIILNSNGTRRGVYDPPTAKFGEPDCRYSAKGERIPKYLPPFIHEERLGPDPSYSYLQPFGSARFFWVPLAFLP